MSCERDQETQKLKYLDRNWPATCMSRQASCISENLWDSGEAVELCKTFWTGWLHFLELSVGRDIDRVPAWLEKASGSGNLTRRDRASLQGEVWKPLDYISRNVQQQQVGRLRANPRRKQTLSSCFEIEVCHIEQQNNRFQVQRQSNRTMLINTEQQKVSFWKQIPRVLESNAGSVSLQI